MELMQIAEEEMPVFNKVAVLERLGGSADLLGDIIVLARADLPARFDQLLMAAVAGDLQELRNVAHTIKGIAANLGAESLSRAAGQMQKLVESKESAAFGEQIARMQEQLGKLLAVLPE